MAVTAGNQEYRVRPRHYLSRAKQRLLDDERESVFYAAFELRCFVEARQDEYLDAQKRYARSIPKSWQIGAQSKALRRLFNTDKIQYLSWQLNSGGQFDAYHVPVSIDLKNRAERLGELLHAQPKTRLSNDPWWAITRDFILDTYRLAWICAHGQLVSPAFLVDGKTIGNVVLDLTEEESKSGAALMTVGAHGILQVCYLERHPDSWVPDI